MAPTTMPHLKLLKSPLDNCINEKLLKDKKGFSSPNFLEEVKFYKTYILIILILKGFIEKKKY